MWCNGAILHLICVIHEGAELMDGAIGGTLAFHVNNDVGRDGRVFVPCECMKKLKLP